MKPVPSPPGGAPEAPSALERTLVAVALRAYPPSFVARLGEEMAAAFDDGWRDARSRGRLPAARFTIRTALNLIRTGVGERLSPAPDPYGPPSPRHEASLMDHIRQDVRYAVRTLLRRPGFTAVAVLTIALGVGANTAIFSVVNGLLFTRLPYPASDDLVTVWRASEGEPDDKHVMSKPDLDDVLGTRALESLVGWSAGDVTLTGVGEAELVESARVTGEPTSCWCEPRVAPARWPCAPLSGPAPDGWPVR